MSGKEKSEKLSALLVDPSRQGQETEGSPELIGSSTARSPCKIRALKHAFRHL